MTRFPSQKYPLETRIQLWEDQGRMCHYCDKPLPKPGTKKGRATQLDHRVSHASGGKNLLSNLVLCCRMCNQEKGGKDYLEYLLWKKERAAKTFNRMNRLIRKSRHA